MNLSAQEFPLVYSCKIYSLPKIIEARAILSKKVLGERGEPVVLKVGHRHLEETLGTDNDVTLYLDRDFKTGYFYGGELGPRLVFDSSIMFLKQAFILPKDQAFYYCEAEPQLGIEGVDRRDEFENDKIILYNERFKFLEDYSKGKVDSIPEVHVPYKLPLAFLQFVLAPSDIIEDGSIFHLLPNVKFIDVPFDSENPNKWKQAFEDFFKLHSL